MKQKLLLIFLLVILPFTLMSQSEESIPELFEIMSNSVSKSGKTSTSKSKDLLMRENNPMTFEIRKMKFPNLKKIADGQKMNKKSPAYFQFEIPKGKKKATGKILAVPKHIEVDDDGNYTYHAELLYKKDLQGDLTLIHQDGKNFGSFTIGDRSFKIEHIEGEGEILIELDTEKLISKGSCPVDMVGKDKDKSSIESLDKTANKILSARSASGGACSVRVLTMFTDAANLVSNPTQFATTAISELNQSLRNSKIYSSQLSFVNVGVQRLTTLTNTSNPINDMETAQSNAQIIAARDAAGADLVMVLINRNYVVNVNGTLIGVNGIAPLDEYTDADLGYVGFVEADSSTKTYGHETGHMFGCRHDTDTRSGSNLPNNLSATAKGHQWYKRNCFFCQKLYRKSVVADGGTGGLPRLYFSNPDVTEESKSRGPTGTSSRNNYLQMLNARSVVSEYDDFDPLIVGIGGPSTVNVGSQYTMTSSVQNCTGTRTYRWERSENGFSYYQVGTGSTYSTYALPLNGNQVYYRLRVTCNGQTVTRTRTVYIYDPNGGGGIFAKTELPELDNEISASSVFPVPASSELNVVISSDIDQRATIKLYGIAPFSYEKKLFDGNINEGSNPLLLDVSNVPQGIYELMVNSDNGLIFKKRILISR